MSDTSFLSRWSRRKVAVREGQAIAAEPPTPAPAPQAPVPARAEGSAPAPQADDAATRPPAPTLADVALLQPGDNIARFVTHGVDESVKRAALKTLFADPHFNVMDGLDIYIDDYSKPDPIPPDVLRRLRQSETLGLFDPVEEEPEVSATPVAGESAESAEGTTAPTEAEAPATAAATQPADAPDEVPNAATNVPDAAPPAHVPDKSA